MGELKRSTLGRVGHDMSSDRITWPQDAEAVSVPKGGWTRNRPGGAATKERVLPQNGSRGASPAVMEAMATSQHDEMGKIAVVH